MHSGVEQLGPRLSIRNPYIFQFLGITPQEVMIESLLKALFCMSFKDAWSTPKQQRGSKAGPQAEGRFNVCHLRNCERAQLLE